MKKIKPFHFTNFFISLSDLLILALHFISRNYYSVILSYFWCLILSNKVLFCKKIQTANHPCTILVTPQQASVAFTLMVCDNTITVSLISVFLLISVYYLYQFSRILSILLLTVIVLSCLSLLFPTASFICMLIIMGLMTAFVIPYSLFDGFFTKRQRFIEHFLKLLEETSILDFFATFYVMFFCIPLKAFYLRMSGLIIIHVLYISASLWYKNIQYSTYDNYHPVVFVALFLIFALGIGFIYVRVLVSISLFLIPLTLSINPSLFSPTILYVFGETDDVPSPPKKEAPIPPNARFSLFSFQRTTNYYRHSFSGKSPNIYRRAAMCLGICTAGGAWVGAFYAKMQAEAAIVQAEAAIVQAEASKAQVTAQIDNNRQMERQNDLEEVSQGLRTRESYTEKWK